MLVSFGYTEALSVVVNSGRAVVTVVFLTFERVLENDLELLLAASDDVVVVISWVVLLILKSADVQGIVVFTGKSLVVPLKFEIVDDVVLLVS